MGPLCNDSKYWLLGDESMNVLIAGAGGYIGTRLIHTLAKDTINIYCLVRSKDRIFVPPYLKGSIKIIEADLLTPDSLEKIPKEIDAAYYLVHSMGQKASGFMEFEVACAKNFVQATEKTRAKQIIYLSGFSNECAISEHMTSRKEVDKTLRKGDIPITTFHAGIIIGSGSASFEIIRDLVEHLPIMIAPRWILSRCQPIGVTDVLYYLKNSLLKAETFGKSYEIGGPDILTYKEMLLQLAQVRKLKRWILSVPLLTPRLSSLWLYLVTSTNFSIARALIESLKGDAICHEKNIEQILPRKCLTYKQAIKRSFQKIEQNAVISSWKNALIQSRLSPFLSSYIQVPEKGCFKEICTSIFDKPKEPIIEHLWKIGGKNGWYFLDWTWSVRGFFDRLTGGVGLNRGRVHPTEIKSGDVLDFWRVLLADKEQGQLLLYAEMRIPGEAWLEWKIEEGNGKTKITQTATFRPKGLLGRLYWYSLFPIHKVIFFGLCKSLGKG